MPAAAFIALAGTLVLTGGTESERTIGELLTVGCAVVFAVHIVLTARYASTRPAVSLTAVQVGVVAVLATPFAARQDAAALGIPFVAWVVGITAVVTTFAAFLLLVWSQARLDATEAGIILAFEPVAAALMSVLYYGEPLTGRLLAGGILILAAMLLAETGSKVRSNSEFTIPNSE